MGKPVIVPNIPSMVDLQCEQFGYICDVDKDYIDAANQLLYDKALYSVMSKRASHYAYDNFDIDKYCNTVKDIYTDVLSK